MSLVLCANITAELSVTLAPHHYRETITLHDIFHMALHYLYQDDDFIAVDKPSGLLCVPGLRDPDNLLHRVQKDYANARVVHRLDMSTSGIVLFALKHSSQKALGQLFERRQISKNYIAVVDGLISQSYGEIQSSIICDWPQRPKQKIDWLNGKPASTYFRVIERDTAQQSTRVQLFPVTGRTHQLRVHMLQIGHPILGDELYQYHNSFAKSPRLTLHAHALRFKHPINEQAVNIESPVPF